VITLGTPDANLIRKEEMTTYIFSNGKVSVANGVGNTPKTNSAKLEEPKVLIVPSQHLGKSAADVTDSVQRQEDRETKDAMRPTIFIIENEVALRNLLAHILEQSD
jgi:hypothetical protein